MSEVMKSKTSVIAGAMKVLARDIQCEDGVANAACQESAERLQELEKALNDANERIKELEDMMRKKLDLIKCAVAYNYGGSPYENENYTEVEELLNEA